MQRARAHEAIDDGGTARRVMGTSKQLILAAKRDVAQLLLADPIVRRETSVVASARSSAVRRIPPPADPARLT